MSFETWAAFAAASAILIVIPGPTVLLVVSYALGQGWRTALPMAAGVALGDVTSFAVSMAGLGALLATSATLFALLKAAGALYLVWLGVKLWRAGTTLDVAPRREGAGRAKLFAHAWLVTALNPKGITFFVAFLPQFLDPAKDWLMQMTIFGATFVTLAFVNAAAYAVLAGRASHLVTNARAVLLLNRGGGAALMAAGAATFASAAGRS